MRKFSLVCYFLADPNQKLLLCSTKMTRCYVPLGRQDWRLHQKSVLAKYNTKARETLGGYDAKTDAR